MSRRVWSLSMAILLGFGSADVRAEPKFKDRARLFRKDDVAVARERAVEIERTYQKDVVVETFVHLPVGYFERQRLKNRNVDELHRYMASWARQQPRGRDGIFIYGVANKDHPYLEVVVGRRACAENAFNEQDRVELRCQIEQGLSEGKVDVLTEAVEFIGAKLRERGYVPAPPYDWGHMAWIVAGLFAGWTVFSLGPDGTALPSLQDSGTVIQ